MYSAGADGGDHGFCFELAQLCKRAQLSSLSVPPDWLGWSALQGTGWPWLLFPRTWRGKMLIPCGDAGAAVMWLTVFKSPDGPPSHWKRPAPSSSQQCQLWKPAHLPYAQRCDRFWSAVLHAVGLLPANSTCIHVWFWAADLTGGRKQFQIFLEVLKT